MLLRRCHEFALCLALLGAVATLAPSRAFAQAIVEDGVVTHKDPLPKRLNGIDIEEHLDRALPLTLPFKDTEGQSVTLAKYVTGHRPVIFTLNYSDCPMLCSLQLSGLVSVLGKVDRRLGSDFEVVTVSLNPHETPERARETEERYRGELTLDTGRDGWHFLTGSQASIDALADALGIRYAYNEQRKEYVHPASLVISTPTGHISRYLYGIEYHARTLSMSIVEAAQGKVGSSVDRLILYCFHYDETEGRYAPVAMNIMRLGGGLTALGLGSFLGAYWLKVARKRLAKSRTAIASARLGSSGSPVENAGS
jgi:protein SCO1/2